MIIDVTAVATPAFPDACLKNDAWARDDLRSGALASSNGMKATLERH